MYKKVNVVMLPTNEKSKIKLSDNNELDFFPRMMYIAEFDWKPQHLYITSNEEIKEGDWIYHLSRKEVFRVHYFDSSNNSKTIVTSDKDFLDLPNIFIKVLVSDCKKIIATTDTSLIIPGEYSISHGIDNYLPQIPRQFIEKWINKYNEGNIIKKVEIEYLLFLEPGNTLNDRKYDKTILKVNSDNTINIKSIKDSWTREELHDLLSKYEYDKGIIDWKKFIPEFCSEVDYPIVENWFEENL